MIVLTCPVKSFAVLESGANYLTVFGMRNSIKSGVPVVRPVPNGGQDIGYSSLPQVQYTCLPCVNLTANSSFLIVTCLPTCFPFLKVIAVICVAPTGKLISSPVYFG